MLSSRYRSIGEALLKFRPGDWGLGPMVFRHLAIFSLCVMMLWPTGTLGIGGDRWGRGSGSGDMRTSVVQLLSTDDPAELDNAMKRVNEFLNADIEKLFYLSVDEDLCRTYNCAPFTKEEIHKLVGLALLYKERRERNTTDLWVTTVAVTTALTAVGSLILGLVNYRRTTRQQRQIEAVRQ